MRTDLIPPPRRWAWAALSAVVLVQLGCGTDTAEGTAGDAASGDDAAHEGDAADAADAGSSDVGEPDAGADAGTSVDASADAPDDAPDDVADASPDGQVEAGNDAAPPDVLDDAATGDAADALADVAADAEPRETLEPVVLELGEHESGATVEVEIPEGSIGFHIVAQADGTEYVGIRTLVSPSGETVLDSFSHEDAPFWLAVDVTGIASTQVPQNRLDSTMPPEAGIWSMVVESSPAEPVDVGVYVQTTVDEGFEGGALDVVIYIPQGLQLAGPGAARLIDAESAVSDGNVAARVDSFFAALGELTGIDRGDVTFVDADARFLAIESQTALGEAAALAAGAPEAPAMHFVWTGELAPFGDGLWGISLGAPGVAVRTGTVRSAVVVDVTAGFSAVADGWTMLHEMGHFVGLLHTSFADGVGDLLTDTPVCPDLEAGIGDGTCPDRTNLMFPVFWGATGGAGIVLSPDQVNVFHGSPLYRAYR